LYELIEPVVRGLGYELVGIEYNPGRGRGLLRVYIDQEEGITVDDCERVSHQLSGLLDVEDPIPGNYTLEVSSPGLDRPLFTKEHFERFRDNRAKIRMEHPIEGRSQFTGLLKGVQGDFVLLEVEDQCVALPLESIAKARLVY
jgi:ribosome maturation factor RimP